MPNSPSINFKIENNNLPEATPQLGVSCLLARTTRGPYNDPSTLLSTYAQFQKLFGEEIVPDGTPSNIEKAFIGGSRLRIIRVPGSGYFKGVLLTSSTDSSTTPTTQQTPKAILTLTHNGKTVTIGFYTKTYDETVDGAKTFDAIFSKQGNTIFCNIKGTGKTDVLETSQVITYKNADTVNRTSVDYLAFYQFLSNSSYLEPVVLTSSLSSKSISGVAKWLAEEVDNSETALTLKVGTAELADGGSTTFISQVGSSGKDPTVEQWVSSLESLRDYTDIYQVACSHISQHLTTDTDVYQVHKAAKELADELGEFAYYIEVPKYTTHYTIGTTVRDKASILTWTKTCQNTIGYSKNVAYFAGGIKYNDDNGILVDSDILGTIIGLGDNSAANYGPWLSFAGMNRGLITDGNGSSCLNYGSPSRYSDLNELANASINMIVVKDTSTLGKKTMLWHCFTSQVKQDSFRFLSIVRLVYYLKKLLRPILESKIEEPNYIPTWRDIYLLVKPQLDDLVEQEAISEYTWQGDQDASGYSDLQVNNEADVRQGKYKAILKFKEIVPMQEVTISLVIDKASNTTSVELTE
jgi:hypothetical protein